MIINFLFFHSIESYLVPNATEQTTLPTVQSNKLLQTLITKPNSYLYKSDEENLLERVKRETTPFVCKGKTNHSLT